MFQGEKFLHVGHMTEYTREDEQKNLLMTHKWKWATPNSPSVALPKHHPISSVNIRAQNVRLLSSYVGGGGHMGKYMGSPLESFVGKQCSSIWAPHSKVSCPSNAKSN